jgi:hypothetical protein
MFGPQWGVTMTPSASRAASSTAPVRMVRHTKHGEPDAVALEHRVSARRLDVAACPDSDDPGAAEMVERVGQRFLAVVEGMVVGERDAVDAEQP